MGSICHAQLINLNKMVRIMERVRQKMNEAKKQRNRLQVSSQTTSKSEKNTHKSSVLTDDPVKHYTLSPITYLLIGCAAGIAISAIVWWVKSAGTVDDARMILLDSTDAIQVNKINKSSEKVADLTERVEALTDAIIGLEVKLRDTLTLADNMADQGRKTVTVEAKPRLHATEPDATAAIADKANTVIAFKPTHTVNAKLNLRPSPSLSSTPITVLNAGTKVKYINKRDGWYFVHTEFHGEGWCSSKYLSPIRANQ